MTYVDNVKPKPDVCGHCGDVDSDTSHWLWHRDKRDRTGGRWRCRIKHRQQTRASVAAYRESNRTHDRYRHYVSKDKKRGRPGVVIPWLEAEAVMQLPCSHCGKPNAGGLDRVDNLLAHTSGNVVPSCGTCNMLLLDMPVEMKNEIAPALRRARKKGLMDLWQHPRLR